MKCVILLSLFALCYSTPLRFGDKMVNIDDDGRFTVTGTNGRKMVITKVSNEVGPDFVKISVEDPFTAKRTMKIVNVGQDEESRRMSSMERLLKKWKGVDTQSDESNESDESSGNVMRRYHKGQTSTDVLTNIFGQHQGVVGDDTFKKILKRADELVRSGELDNSIYEVLNEFGGNTLTSTRGGSSLFRPTGFLSDEGRMSFLKTKTQEELKQRTGLNELRRALFRGNPQVSFYSYEGIPIAYRYTDILPNSGLNGELPQILGDSQGNDLELVPLQEIMQDAKYQPALMDYLRRSHQSTQFQSTQMIPELLEQFSQIQKKRLSNQQQDVDEESQEEQREMIRRIMRENM